MVTGRRSGVVGALVQARTGSARLPGKVVADLAGKPLLSYVFESLMRVEQLDKLVCTTSLSSSDDRVAQLADELDVDCFRGPLHDVAGRMLQAAEVHGIDVIVRISGDSPFISHQLVADAIERFLSSNCDLVTNVAPRTFPVGQSVEVFRTRLLEEAYQSMEDASYREHVTTYFYEDRGDELTIYNLEHQPSLAHLSMAVDSADDLRRARKVLHSMTIPPWHYEIDNLAELFVTAGDPSSREAKDRR